MRKHPIGSKHSKHTIAVLGAGTWGTTLAVLLSQKKQHTVILWSAFKEHAASMKETGYNKDFMNIKLPDDLQIADSLSETLSRADIVVLALPVKYLSGLLIQIKKTGIAYSSKIYVNVAKGIDTVSLKTVSGMVSSVLGKVAYAVLSGPNIAKEVLEHLPSVAAVASKQTRIALLVQDIFSTPYFRVYSHHDVVGIELAGALKNVIALACGISDGLGFGTNTKAALVSRGLAEMRRLGKVLKASSLTFSGVAGLGDLVTTCFSPFSRNRTAGERIGCGDRLEEILTSTNMVAEGIDSVKAAHKLSKKYKVSMPITEQVYHVVYRQKSPANAVKDLMLREKKVEIA